MESKSQFDLKWIIPKFSEFSFIPTNGNELSVLFIVILITVASLFTIAFGYHFVKTRGRIGWLKKQLKGLDRTNILPKREQLYAAALDKKDGVGHLWLEFDETLVEVKSGDTFYLRNTLDAGHFFNTHTLAKQVTENRLIAAVPGFLTAIGVIGTFVGLQVGLSGLQLGANVPVDLMQEGMANVVNGAKVAFLTSVWGVALSVIFNFGEKWFEQRIRNSIGRIEDKIDHIFPRIRPEDQLQVIAEHGAESREALQGLAEKIGIKMQDAMVTATEGIQSSLEKSLTEIMAPAINKLMDETSQGNQKALDGLLQNFMDGFGEQGSMQRQALDNVSEKVNKSVDAMQHTMNNFVEQLQNSQSESGEREKELISNISNQVSRLVTQGDEINTKLGDFVESKVNDLTASLTNREEAAAKREEQLVSNISKQVSELVINSRKQGETLTEFFETQLSGVTQKLNERDERVSVRENARDEKITQQTETIANVTERVLLSVDNSIKNQVESASALILQGQTLQTSIETSVQANAQATQAMKESATELRVSADRMSILSSHIKDAGNQLAGAIKEGVESTRDISLLNQGTAESMEVMREQLLGDVSRFSALTEKLSDMLAVASNTFGELKQSQREYISQLKDEVGQLSTQMTTMLEDYASRANATTAQHLTVWSDSVTQYSTQMTSAVKVLSNVVDEMNEKLG